MAHYNYTIELDKLKDTIQDAINGGYTAYVIINGEYYEIKAEKTDTEKINFWEV